MTLKIQGWKIRSALKMGSILNFPPRRNREVEIQGNSERVNVTLCHYWYHSCSPNPIVKQGIMEYILINRLKFLLFSLV